MTPTEHDAVQIPAAARRAVATPRADFENATGPSGEFLAAGATAHEEPDRHPVQGEGEAGSPPSARCVSM
ncbi:MAG TPA: hypothetical protein VNQ31_04635 [Sphingomonadaceae bacterium]|nr:hypothetical protein [Sphingomonadaceae bacterium]